MLEYKNEEERAKDIAKNREVAAFAYLLILSPVLLFTRRDSPFIQFHAKQATLLFIFAVLFAQLQRPWSWMNFFILAIALTGFIQANFGSAWRAPIIANIIETGVSGDSIWQGIVHYARVLKHVFVRKTETEQKKASPPNIPVHTADNLAEVLAQQNEVLSFQRERIEFLERELLMASILRKHSVKRMGEKEKEAIKEYAKRLAHALHKNARIDITPYVMRISFGKHEILFGGFDVEEKGGWVYTTLPLKRGEPFGKYMGVPVSLHDEKEQNSLLSAIKKAKKSETYL